MTETKTIIEALRKLGVETEVDEVTDKTKWFVVVASIVLMTAIVSVACTVLVIENWN